MFFRKAKTILIGIALLGGAGIVLVAATPDQAMAASFNSDACQGVSQIGGGNGCNSNPGSTVSNLLKDALGLLSYVVGFVAVVMVIVSGFRFMTANGDSSSIATARTSLVYALVGMMVAAMAQVIVHFVINRFSS